MYGPIEICAAWGGVSRLLLLAAAWLAFGLTTHLGAVRAAEHEPELPAIAIIIDDVGYRQAEGLRALSLPGAVTYAVLPHTPFAAQLAKTAMAQNKEVLLHQPMESTRGLALGPGAITADMTAIEVAEVVSGNLRAVPQAAGISNHMGSLLSTRAETVGWVMQAVHDQQRHLFIVDSRTADGSVIAATAREYNIPSIARDVFLDHTREPYLIQRQFERLVAHAKERGTALAIAHPHHVTLKVLERELGRLEDYGVRLVRASRLLKEREISRRLTAKLPTPRRVPANRKPRT